MQYLDGLFRSTAVEKAMSGDSHLARMLEVEAALALAEAEVGLLSPAVALNIQSCCDLEMLDREALVDGAKQNGNLAIPLVKLLTQAVAKKAPDAGRFVHWGATSQDIIDTALVLQTREALSSILGDLRRICDALRALTERHRKTVMPGRTWMQHAIPVTFGVKTAYMLSAVHRQLLRIQDVRASVAVVQFGGAAGTLAALGGNGALVSKAMAKYLGLAEPTTPWHSHRDRIAEVAACLGVLCGVLGKIARDVSLMGQTEVGEVSELRGQDRGSSSTMPQKNNPVLSAAILANCVRVPGLVSTVLAAMVQEHERGLGGWHAEWETLPEIISLSGGAAERTSELLSGLEVHGERMRANLDLEKGMIFCETISAALSQKIGKSAAHELVQQAVKQAKQQDRHLREVLCETAGAQEQLSSDDIVQLFVPERYLGSAELFIARVLADCADPIEA